MEDSAKYVCFDGELRRGTPPAGVHLLQHIHTLAYEARHVQAHIDLLRSAARRLFGLDLRLTARDTSRGIAELLAAERTSRMVSVCATLRVYPSGRTCIDCDEPSIYAGYVLRSLRPEAVCLHSAAPMPQFPTSAAEAARDLADAAARARGFRTALPVDGGGRVVYEAVRPLFAVQGYTLYAPPAAADFAVERRLVADAARLAGFDVRDRVLTTADLAAADEVLTADWQGITAMGRIGRKPYMSIIAERIALRMEDVVL